MASTLTITLTSPLLSGSKTFNFQDADMQTLVNYMSNKYGSRGPSGDLSTPAITPAQALNFWVTDFIQRTIGEIQQSQRQNAMNAVVVPPIVVT